MENIVEKKVYSYNVSLFALNMLSFVTMLCVFLVESIKRDIPNSCQGPAFLRMSVLLFVVVRPLAPVFGSTNNRYICVIFLHVSENLSLFVLLLTYKLVEAKRASELE